MRLIPLLSAFVILTILTACSKPDFEKSLTQAEELIGIGQYQKAEGIYKKLIAHAPDAGHEATFYLRLGGLYSFAMTDRERGLEAYQKCIELSPYSEAARIAHERRADIFQETGPPAKVAEEYAALLKYFPEHPNFSEYRLRLGEAYISGQEYQQAREELREFVEGTGVDPELRHRALFDIGETYFLESKPGKAVRFYYAFVKEAPRSPLVPEAQLRIATCLEEMGYLGMAQKFAKEAGQEYPNPEVVEKRLEGIEKRGKKTYSKKKDNKDNKEQETDDIKLQK